MDDGDVAKQAKRLRRLAASLLQEAIRCIDPAWRDALITAALVRLSRARVLRNQVEAESSGQSENPSRAKLH